MSQVQLFSSGQELANSVVNSSLLHLSYNAILAAYAQVDPSEPQYLPFTVSHKVHHQSNSTVIAFITSPACTKFHLQEAKELLPSAAVKDIFPPFESLLTRGNSSLAIHNAAITSFAAYHNKLAQLKVQYGNSGPLIITGHSLGGSIAALFTLWLLENINEQSSKRPICITFGAPLLGDNGLRKTILEHSTWNSCFLHVAATRDPVPRHLNNSSAQNDLYKPFGMYLFCSEMGCTCLEIPEAIAEVLEAMKYGSTRNQQANGEFLIDQYGMIIQALKSRVIVRGTSQLGEAIRHSLRAGITLQLEETGVKGTQQNSNVNGLISKIERRERDDLLSKRQVLNPAKKLNDIKVKMALLEWYKKKSNHENMSYYDSCKNKRTQSDHDVVQHQRFLTRYWRKIVEEAENNLQKEVTMSRTRWLYGGTNYRRMVEPLDIAEYYHVKGLRGYISNSNGRSQHYKKLEKLLAEAERPRDSCIELKKQNVGAILTEDSCFWAHVEEALLSCKSLREADSSIIEKELSRENLIKFEEYVFEMIKNYAVSPEIFLQKSSFMEWWRQYEEIKGPSYNSSLTEIMRSGRYLRYAKGLLVL